MASISSVITGGFGTPGSASLVITDGYGTLGAVVVPPSVDIVSHAGIGGKRRKHKVIRFSDFAVRDDLVREVRKAIPIPRPTVVRSVEDMEDEEFIIINLIGLLDD